MADWMLVLTGALGVIAGLVLYRLIVRWQMQREWDEWVKLLPPRNSQTPTLRRAENTDE